MVAHRGAAGEQASSRAFLDQFHGGAELREEFFRFKMDFMRWNFIKGRPRPLAKVRSKAGIETVQRGHVCTRPCLGEPICINILAEERRFRQPVYGVVAVEKDVIIPHLETSGCNKAGIVKPSDKSTPAAAHDSEREQRAGWKSA